VETGGYASDLLLARTAAFDSRDAGSLPLSSSACCDIARSLITSSVIIPAARKSSTPK